MKPANFARVVVTAGIALGLGTLAAPAAFADAIYNPGGGDITIQQEISAEDSIVGQAAGNDVDTSIAQSVQERIAAAFNRG